MFSRIVDPLPLLERSISHLGKISLRLTYHALAGVFPNTFSMAKMKMQSFTDTIDGGEIRNVFFWSDVLK